MVYLFYSLYLLSAMNPEACDFHLSLYKLNVRNEYSIHVHPAQFDIDNSSGVIYQHYPIEEGEKAPYEGILMKGSRYATLKLAEFKLSIKEQELARMQQSYSKLERSANQCKTQLLGKCPKYKCDKPEFYESAYFWIGVLGGALIPSIVILMASI